MESIDPKNITPRRDWALVLTHPRKKHTAGGILLPEHETYSEKVAIGTGEVISVGPGEMAAKLDLKPGDRIAFRTYLKHAHKLELGLKWSDGTEKYYSLVALSDIDAVLGPGVEVGAFSGKTDS